MNDKTKVIGICYIVFGALGILGLPMIYVHQLFMDAMLSSMAEVDSRALEVIQLFQNLMEILVPLLVILMVAHIVFNVLLGICFIRHKAYYTCLISSILTCFVFPVGTLLGVFALIALSDEKIKPLFYRSRPASGRSR